MRIAWVDTAKGLAIILVVLAHTWRGLNKAGMLTPSLFESVDARLYAFFMPLFFMIAGLFFENSLNKADVWAFLKTRLERLLYPLLLWTYIFIFAKLVAGSMTNTPVGADDFLISPIPGRWHYWFLWALFLIQIGLLAVKPILLDIRHQPLGLLTVFAGALVLSETDLPAKVNHWAGAAIDHLPYFVFGIILGRYYLGRRVSPLLAMLAVGAFAGVQVELFSDHVTGIPPRLTAFLLSICVIVALTWLSDRSNILTVALSFVGERSMPIYLAHVIFSAGAREVLLNFSVKDLTLHVIICTIAGTLFPIAMYEVAKRLKLAGVLGL